MTGDIIVVSRPLVSVNDLIGGSMRAVRGVWDSGANIIHWIVERLLISAALCLIRVTFPVCIVHVFSNAINYYVYYYIGRTLTFAFCTSRCIAQSTQ